MSIHHEEAGETLGITLLDFLFVMRTWYHIDQSLNPTLLPFTETP